MSRAQTNKLFKSLSRGLITEVSALSSPDDASLDELNCDIISGGKRSRRYGLEGFGDSFYISDNLNPSLMYSNYIWEDPDNEQGLSFLCLQLDSSLRFYQIYSETSLFYLGSIDLSEYLIDGKTEADLNSSPAQLASGKGVLVVTHKFCDPVLIKWDGSSLSSSKITIKIRDFEGVDDSLSVEEEPSVLSSEHRYNLKNQGWVSSTTGSSDPVEVVQYSLFGDGYATNVYSDNDPISEYFTSQSRYPSNSKVWWVAKDENGDFDPALLSKVYTGNTRAVRGHYILDAFNVDRSSLSGVSGLPVDAKDYRPEAVCFYSGRAFFGAKSTVYFSTLITAPEKVGDCFQEADPTSEDISDILSTDGGVVEISGAQNISKLAEFQNGVLVFADNGVWFISSSDTGFSATDYVIKKISEFGSVGIDAIVQTETSLFWWSETGIQGVSQAVGQFGAIQGVFNDENLSQKTIQAFYNNITSVQQKGCEGVFDPATNKIYWMYQDSSDTQPQKVFKNILIFDLEHQAFIPWSISDNEWEHLVGAVKFPTIVEGPIEKSFIVFLTSANIHRTETDWDTHFNFCHFLNKDKYVDFEQTTTINCNALKESSQVEDSDYSNYDSYIETGHTILEDALRKKQVPTLGIFFDTIEDTSCFFQTKWEWSNSGDSGKWSRKFQAYRKEDLNYDVTWTRNKIRGSGKSVRFRFSENSLTRGFTLLGWQPFYEGIKIP